MQIEKYEQGFSLLFDDSSLAHIQVQPMWILKLSQ